jgi:LmbE family N-acetylglucosaminyl deacetylase
VLHVAPHPDDEALGAPATLLALRDAGWKVVNLACSLGSDSRLRDTRRAEVAEACRRAGFDLRVASTTDVADEISEAVAAERPALVVSPDPQEAHPAHASVGRATGEALAGPGPPVRWWTWALWTELTEPTMLVPFGEDRLDEILHVLAAHESQLARNDFATLVRARAQAARVRGPERIHGFGSPGIGEPYAELLRERPPEPARHAAGAE